MDQAPGVNSTLANQLVTASVRITVRVQIDGKVRQYIAEGESFDDCLAHLRKMNAQFAQHGSPIPIVGEAS